MMQDAQHALTEGGGMERRDARSTGQQAGSMQETLYTDCQEPGGAQNIPAGNEGQFAHCLPP